MDPKLAALMAMIGGKPGGPAMGGMPQGGPPMPSPPMGGGNAPMAPPPAPPSPMVGNGAPASTLSPPQANPGALLSAAGMQAPPTNAPMPSRPGDMMNPVAPTTDEPIGARGLPLRQALPSFQRTTLGALLIPPMISG